MFTLPSLPVFIFAALGLLIMPGPAVIYIVTRSVGQGRGAGLASVLGIELATLVHSAAAAVGLSAILMASATAFSVVKYAGAAYLVFLGIKALVSKDEAAGNEGDRSRTFLQLAAKGFLVNLLNPKTALFFYAFLPQFVDPGRGAVAQQILFLGFLFVAMATCTDSLYAMAGSGVGKLLVRHPGIQRVRHYVTGGVYIALGIFTAASGRGKE
jgi:threonine/homoserine/homoserine lactone efflux protein